MIEVTSFTEILRMEGPNVGRPTLEVLLGSGAIYTSVDDLVKEIYLRPNQGGDILFRGGESTQVGMGELAKILYTLGFRIEMETSGSRKTVSWFNVARCWIVDYIAGGLTDYNALRKCDALRFVVERERDLEYILPFLNEGYEELQCSTYIKLKSNNEKLFFQCYSLTKKFKELKLFGA